MKTPNLEAFANTWIDRRRALSAREPAELPQECGVTSISLENAYWLLTNLSVPTHIVLVEEPNEWYVDATWIGEKFDEKTLTHRFSGFSWGYGGEGPHGLKVFLDACGFGDCINPFSSDVNGNWYWDDYEGTKRMLKLL
jgi:hypothetical protein